MKLKFKHQHFQTDAVHAVTDLFKRGQLYIVSLLGYNTSQETRAFFLEQSF